jgi:hypothetical protein
MAGKGPPPKDALIRQRSNKKSSAAALVAPENPKVQPLPKGRAWMAETKAWWNIVWSSPMAGEYLDSDRAGLVRVAILVDDFNAADSPSLRTKLMTEIRLQEARFGLSPVDRARLHWEVAKGEEAERKRQKPKPPVRQKDPRAALRVV